MLKYAIVLLSGCLLSISTAFAGADTDRICSDTTKRGKIYDTINVSYPGEKVSVSNVFKITFSENDIPVYDEKARDRLYYVVNIQENKTDSIRNKRSELYEYDCQTKTPKLLLSLKIYGNGESYYSIDYHNKGNLIIAQKFFGMADGGTERIIGYNIYQKEQLFNVKWNNTEGSVDGFVVSKNNWYLYFASSDFVEEGSLYGINKKTKKITKL